MLSGKQNDGRTFRMKPRPSKLAELFVGTIICGMTTRVFEK